MHFLKPPSAATGYVQNESKPWCNVSVAPRMPVRTKKERKMERKKPTKKMKRFRLLRNVYNFCSECGKQWKSPLSYLLEFWRRGNFFFEILEIYIMWCDIISITSAMCELPWKTTSYVRIRNKKKKERIFPEPWRLGHVRKIWNATVCFVIPVLMEHLGSHGWICIASDTGSFPKIFQENGSLSKYYKNNEYFTWIRM